jgi:hypothetical protein
MEEIEPQRRQDANKFRLKRGRKLNPQGPHFMVPREADGSNPVVSIRPKGE